MNSLVAIVGGSGFIGSTVCRKLVEQRARFIILDKRESTMFPDQCTLVDVRSLKDLSAALADCSTIINLAAEHRDDVFPRSLYDEVNVGGARNICAAAEDNGISRIIFTSSVAVYGFAEPGTDESGAYAPFNDYGRTKMDAEAVYRAWHAKDPLRRTLVIIRPTVVFGERNRGNVYTLLRQIAGNRFIMIGKGLNRKSMAYVENVADFLQFSMKLGPGEHLFNYADEPVLNMNGFVAKVQEILGMKVGLRIRLPFWAGITGGLLFDLLAKVSGKRLPISSIRVRKFCAETLFSSTRVAATGFRPLFSLSEALKRTVEFEFLGTTGQGELYYSE
jgi:GlcNAc-P-P-Und epimerase